MRIGFGSLSPGHLQKGTVTHSKVEMVRVRAMARKVRLETQTQVTIAKRFVLISRMSAVPLLSSKGGGNSA